MARALAMGPQVLPADEPTAALDDTATRAVDNLLAEFVTGGGRWCWSATIPPRSAVSRAR
ncbi:hypothetical protein [Nocardia carnea]|uniref:hypothetical protein n=1 Tax=Nocardia carnea TaxID=37328 RepID=UPI003D776CB7